MELKPEERLVGNLMGLAPDENGVIQAHGIRGLKWGDGRLSQKIEGVED